MPTTPKKSFSPAQFERYTKRFTLIPLHRWDDVRTLKGGKTLEQGKAPIDRDWTKKTYDSERVRKRCIENDRNVGVRLTDEQLVIDVDPRNGGLAGFEKLCNALSLTHEDWPRVITGSGGFHCYLSKPAGLSIRDTLDDFPGVEFKSLGRQVVAAGSRHPNGELYRWSEDHPDIRNRLPPCEQALLNALARPPRVAGADGGEHDQEQIAAMLSRLDATKFDNNKAWFNLMAAVHAASNGEARQEYIDWSLTDSKYAGQGEAMGRRWDSLHTDRPGGITTSSLYAALRKAGAGDMIPAQKLGDDEFQDEPEIPADAIVEDWSFETDIAKADPDFDEEISMWKPSEKNPLKAAQEFKLQKHPTLIHHNGDWMVWNGSHYADVEDATIKSQLYGFLATGHKPNRGTVANAEDALKAVAHVPLGTFEPPCWLDGNAPFPANEVLAFKDGLLHLPTMKLIDPTSNFFTRNALTYSFEADAGKPHEWARFLLDIFKGSRKSIGVLQEIFGYMLLADNAQQKMFLWDSPPRGGKGTSLRVLEALIGRHNSVSPSMGGLAKDAILASLVSKQLAIISDMRIDKHTNVGVVAENLLRITGGDSLTFDRKYKDAWTGRILARFFMLTNLPPNIPDVSGALFNRFIILKSFESYLDREDHELEGRLMAELPGILLWAIEGWRRLKARGRFVQPPEGALVMRRMIDRAQPVTAFVRERCMVEADAVVSKSKLYDAWDKWEVETGAPAMVDAVFARNLLAGCGGRIRETRLWNSGDRVQAWQGIRLRDYSDPDLP